MGEAAINRFINSRVLTWLTAVVGIVAAYAMLLFFGTPSVPPVEGLFGGGLDYLLPSGILSWAVNMVVVFVQHWQLYLVYYLILLLVRMLDLWL